MLIVAFVTLESMPSLSAAKTTLKIHFGNINFNGGQSSSAVSSAPTNLRSRVRIPSTLSNLLQPNFVLYVFVNVFRKMSKINKKRPGLAHFLKNTFNVLFRLRRKNIQQRGGSLGLVVMGDSSSSRGCGFKSQRFLLD